MLHRAVIAGLFGCTRRKVYTNKIQLHHISYLTPTGLRNYRDTAKEGVLRFQFVRSLLYREVPF